MGNVLKRVHKPKDFGNVFVDFINVEPSESDKSVYESTEEYLNESDKILDALNNYRGVRNEIKDHMVKPSPETEDKLFKRIVPCMYSIKG